jgi:hypothetical protein
MAGPLLRSAVRGTRRRVPRGARFVSAVGLHSGEPTTQTRTSGLPRVEQGLESTGPTPRISSLSSPRRTTAVIGLHRRARDRAVGTEYATVASERLKPHPAALAVIEKHAGIGRHRLDGPMTARGASQGAFQLHHALRSARNTGRPDSSNPRRLHFLAHKLNPHHGPSWTRQGAITASVAGRSARRSNPVRRSRSPGSGRRRRSAGPMHDATGSGLACLENFRLSTSLKDVHTRLLDIHWTQRLRRTLSYWYPWRSLAESNRSLHRERVVLTSAVVCRHP